jgi:hypothetical protein
LENPVIRVNLDFIQFHFRVLDLEEYEESLIAEDHQTIIKELNSLGFRCKLIYPTRRSGLGNMYRYGVWKLIYDTIARNKLMLRFYGWHC